MSAATSGFDLPLEVIPITEANYGFEVGRRLQYIRKFCVAQKLFSDWEITRVADNYIEVKPLRTLHVLEIRRLTREQVLYHFRFVRGRPCR